MHLAFWSDVFFFIVSNSVYVSGGGSIYFFSRKMMDFFTTFVSENFPVQGNDLVYGFSAFRACYQCAHKDKNIQ